MILVDNCANSEGSLKERYHSLREQMVIIFKICQHIWEKNSANRIAIFEMSPNARMVKDFTTDSNDVKKALGTIDLGTDNDFLNSLWIAITLLENIKESKRLFVFISNPIQNLPDFKTFCESHVKNVPLLTIDFILIGDSIEENRIFLKPLENSMKNKTLNIFELKKVDENEIMIKMFGKKVVTLVHHNHSGTLKANPPILLGKSNEDIIQQINAKINDVKNDKNIDNKNKNEIIRALEEDRERIRHNMGQTSDQKDTGKVELGIETPTGEVVTQRNVEEIEAKINTTKNNKYIDSQTRNQIIRGLEEERKTLIARVGQTSEPIKFNPDLVPDNDKDLEEAIKASLEENYKNNTSEKGLSDASNQPKQQNSSKEVNKKKKKPVKKFKEGSEDD